MFSDNFWRQGLPGGAKLEGAGELLAQTIVALFTNHQIHYNVWFEGVTLGVGLHFFKNTFFRQYILIKNCRKTELSNKWALNNWASYNFIEMSNNRAFEQAYWLSNKWHRPVKGKGFRWLMPFSQSNQGIVFWMNMDTFSSVCYFNPLHYRVTHEKFQTFLDVLRPNKYPKVLGVLIFRK